MRPRVLAVVLAPLVAACGDLTVSIRAELMRLPDATPLASSAGASTSVPPWTSNVTLTSVRSPITVVQISGEGVTIELYRCSGATASACLVELNGPALESLLPTGPVAVQAGTYDQIAVGSCLPGGSEWTAQITGTTVLEGTTYYTRTAGNQLGTTAPAQPVNVSFDGCGLLSPIVPPLVITGEADADILLRLYFDMRDLAWAALNHATTNQLLLGPGCSGPSTTGFICAAYTTVFAVPGTDVPVVERYRVNTNATFGLVFEPGTDRFVGGYVRRFYIEDAGFSPGFGPDGHFDILTPSGPVTYRLAQSHAPQLDLPLFERASHSGTLSVDVGNPTPLVLPYTAVRLP